MRYNYVHIDDYPKNCVWVRACVRACVCVFYLWLMCRYNVVGLVCLRLGSWRTAVSIDIKRKSSSHAKKRCKKCGASMNRRKGCQRLNICVDAATSWTSLRIDDCLRIMCTKSHLFPTLSHPILIPVIETLQWNENKLPEQCERYGLLYPSLFSPVSHIHHFYISL